MSSYYCVCVTYLCVLILLLILILLYIAVRVSSYYYTLVYMCPHTAGMEGPGVADGVRPCCTFGYTNYAVRMNPCARVPATGI